MNPRSATLTTVLSTSCLFAVACGGEGGGKASARTNLQPALAASVDGTVVDAFVTFTTSAGELESKIAAFCEARTESSLSEAQQQWRDTTEHWNRAALYNLGPLDDDIIVPSILFVESMRQRGTDFTNTVEDAIERDLSSEATLDAAFFEALNFREVGLLALEVLLFQDTTPDHSIALVDVVADFDARARKCAYTEGMAALMKRRAQHIEDGWTTSFLDTGRSFRDLLIEGELRNGAEPVPELLRAIIRHVEYLRRRKLQAQPDAQLAGSFFDNIRAGIGAIRTFFSTDTGVTVEGRTFFAAMEANGFASDVALLNAVLDRADAAAEEENQTAAAVAFSDLELTLRREVPIALRVDLGLTFTDGD